MVSSSSQPELLPPAPTLGGTSQLDRLAAELTSLQQQASADQAAIKLLQEREMASMAATGGTSDVLGLGAALVAAVLLVVLAWTVVRTYLAQRGALGSASHVHRTAVPEFTRTSELRRYMEPLEPRTDLASIDPMPWEQPPAAVEPPTPPLPADASQGTVSEVAAGEVMRVRRSLAEKRQARARGQEPEPPDQDAQDTRADIDLALDEQTPAPAPASAPAQPVVAVGVDVDVDVDVDIALDVPGSLPEQAVAVPTETYIAPELIDAQSLAATERDYAVTLALAYESEGLELWQEARALANEVLETDDPRLRADARALLTRIDRNEPVAVAEEMLSWDDNL